MDELEGMRAIDEILQNVEDELARARVAGWVAAKYSGALPGRAGSVAAVRVAAPPGSADRVDEIPGIAKLSQDGEILLTVRDLKARNTNDAAIRLVHVLIWAAQKLTGSASVSSRRIVTPLLQRYRCYDGNTRHAVASDRGIVRDGDELSLDFHAEQRAEQFVSEILDASVEGQWRPGGSRRRSPRLRAASDAGAR
ncbi:MAG: hypothetical protein ABSB50_20155 [Terracidiphilus sp.]